MNPLVANTPAGTGPCRRADDATSSGAPQLQSIVETALAALGRDGFVILDALIDPQDVARLDDELAPWLAATPRCVGDFYGWRTTRVGGLLDKAPSAHALVLHPVIVAIADALLAPACDCIQLNLTQAVQVHPGERAQAPHRDEEMWPCPKGETPWLLNVMWAVSDFTEANGATRLWPGSHRGALDREVDPHTSVAGAMARGSALLFIGALTHGAGANRSAHPRTGVIVSYCLGWLKQYENQFLAYPPSVARSFPEELQRLIGYRMHRPNLGGWEGQDPIAALGETCARAPHIDALTPDIQAELDAHYRVGASAQTQPVDGG
ncbi:MAG: phytanoyl-CoA dioxygenase family protein [Hyphomonadaceae bacterium]|nr:phytanoyl-CoA dioxygenase family protein [Hyphomonadaceae bacterium]